MSSSSPRPSLLDPSRPIRSLSIAFGVWKAILFVIIACCPGLGYDTSSSHLPFPSTSALDVLISSGDPSHASLPIPLKFVRWDSIYFVHIAQAGYVFEQEWAFSYVYGKLVDRLTSVFSWSDASSGVASLAVTAVVLAHLTHFLSVLALYKLSINVFGNDSVQKQQLLCFLSAALHIVSPAGAFLSSLNAESLFSFLHITGFYIYSSSRRDHHVGKHVASYAKLVVSGILFAVATTVRSNGILSGILLAYDAVLLLHRIVSQRSLGEPTVHLCFVVLSGCILALGLIIPQTLAYISYCTTEDVSRPWCQFLVPSIYSWVQSHYWDVGFFRYWTLSNLPLFLLSTPMLLILFLSCFWARGATVSSSSPKTSQANSDSASGPASTLLTQLAITQFLLAVLALTSYHVQIINRISSGYPLWYWYIASQLLDTRSLQSTLKSRSYFSRVVQLMVVYALVQATLYGSFLPPA